MLENTVDKNAIPTNSVFNVDESGFTKTASESNCSKRQAPSWSYYERGSGREHGSSVCCQCSGVLHTTYEHFQKELEMGAPLGSVIEISDTGYINSELFVSWLKHFKRYVNCSIESPVLLLLDGHTTNSRNMEAVE
ncbi:hypothetical protein J437_LFUL013798 [Ladona fulva]|uniref:DDE-1 domain-containing protein n=1 Tax=Ladona fulva TaxID=123851 RepID=A0A8K0P577_LADFU|nr:hypothetical protein J437_LFUL013798 [Ladona fulva]